jgi:hypothetical protein
LAEPFIGKLKNLSRRHYKISRSRPNKIPGEKGTRRKCQNKMNKSFLLSGGRKNDRFGSGFKPATLPDLQNGNANGSGALLKRLILGVTEAFGGLLVLGAAT